MAGIPGLLFGGIMEFLKYQHIERFGTDETEGIDEGVCYVFPKIDGTNGSIWLDDGVIKAGSRNRELTLENDNAGFYAWVLQQENIIEFLKEHETFRLYGEWLVPHTLKTYEESAWKKFYVFDVYDTENRPYDYETYSEVLYDYNIDIIDPLCTIKNPMVDKLIELLDKNTYLIKDGQGVGEGIVIKNYNYINKYGRQTWAKIVRNEFKTQNKKAFGIPEIGQTAQIEEKIVIEFCTETLIEKEYAKIVTESDGWKSQYIPKLLATVYYCLVNEEIWNIVKKYKNPTIDFGTIIKWVNRRVKEVKPELF